MIGFLPPMGGTRAGELDRSAEMVVDILARNADGAGPYYVLMFLLDSGYGREDIREIAERLHPKKIKTPFTLNQKESN